jgi:hypothetical protein
MNDRANERRQPIDDWLAAARADLATREPPAWLESSLAARLAERAALARLRSLAPPARRARRARRWIGLAAMATVVLAVAVGVASIAPSGPPPARPTFLAVAPLETIAAEVRPIVVAAQMPRAQLAAYGMPVDPTRAETVHAEFLISRRGSVLAVRFSPE